MDNKFIEDNNLQMIFVVEDLKTKNNGIIESVLRKIKYIEDTWGHRPILLTSMYNMHLTAFEAYFSGEGKTTAQTSLNADTRVFSIFDYFLERYPYRTEYPMKEYIKRGDINLRYEALTPDILDVYKGERLLRREYFNTKDGGSVLVMVETYKEGSDKNKRTLDKVLVYDGLGYLTVAMLSNQEKKDYWPHEYYYTPEGSLRMRADYRYIEDPNRSHILANRVTKNHNELISYTLFDNRGRQAGVIKTHEQLIALCLDCITNDPAKKYLIFDECALFTGAGTLFKKPNVKAATIIHSVFLDDPYDLKSSPQPYYKTLCENRKKYDGIIMLTKEETKDFYTKYEPADNLFTICHPYPFPIVKAPYEGRDHKKAVLVARFDPIKRIDEAVSIFALVVKAVPDATFDIYGYGGDEDAIRKRIEELELKESVKIKGFTSEVAKVLSGCACFLMTSVMEGLGITLLEAASNGCPIFSYDIKYGPATIIRDKVTGFLFKNDDKQSFAKGLIRYFKDPAMQKRMHENCYDDAVRFSVPVFLDKWREVCVTLCERMG